MRNIFAALLLCVSWGAPLAAEVQTPMQTSGTLVVMPAFGEVRHVNNQARATFMIEEEDKEKAAAASRVNQKMKQGMKILKRQDLPASFRTRGYYTYPVYADDQTQPRQSGRARVPVSWRVGQFLEVTTSNLDGLPKAVAAVQSVLALNNLSFGLTEETLRKLDEQRIAAAYEDLTARIKAIAKAMGRNPLDAVLEVIDFEGGASSIPQHDAVGAKAMRATSMETTPVEEPSFEPGETTLNTRLTAKVKFK